VANGHTCWLPEFITAFARDGHARAQQEGDLFRHPLALLAGKGHGPFWGGMDRDLFLPLPNLT